MWSFACTRDVLGGLVGGPGDRKVRGGVRGAKRMEPHQVGFTLRDRRRGTSGLVCLDFRLAQPDRKPLIGRVEEDPIRRSGALGSVWSKLLNGKPLVTYPLLGVTIQAEQALWRSFRNFRAV